MKYLYYLSSLFLVMAIYSCNSTKYYQGNPDEYSQNYDQQQNITYQQFYNDLSPYGNWIDYGNYGFVWVPGQTNFRPYYTNGYWVYTDYGWTWVSNYNWGWAPFHYGRWINDRRFGWMWIPGYQWAPAWVMWRGGGDYYGWAPLAPGMDINMNYGSIPYDDWTFVPGHYINSRRLNNYYVNPARNGMIINNTTIINNNIFFNNQQNRDGRPAYNPGPPVREVEQTTGTRIRKYNLISTNKPEPTRVSNSAVRVFRPAVNQQAGNSNPRPQKIADLNEIRSTHSAPVREVPKNQTPQILRNEPPVNNNAPGINPGRNNATPQRVFPNRNTTPPAENRPVPQEPVNRNALPENDRKPENPTRNNLPERTFPNNPNPPQTEQKIIRNSPADNNRPDVTPAERRPVRTFPAPPRKDVNQNMNLQNNQGINRRSISSPPQATRENQQQSRPAPQIKQEENTSNQRPVRTFTPSPVPPQKQQETENRDENRRTFNPQKR